MKARNAKLARTFGLLVSRTLETDTNKQHRALLRLYSALRALHARGSMAEWRFALWAVGNARTNAVKQAQA